MMRADDHIPDFDLRRRLDAVYDAHMSTARQATGDIPSTDEIRELLHLFAQLGHEDLRHAVLCLLRTIVGPSP